MNKNIAQIWDIKFTTLNKGEILNLLHKKLEQTHHKALLWATPNPEMLLETLINPEFKEILKSTDLNIPDGVGLIWACNFLEKNKNRKSKIRITASGLARLLCLPLARKFLTSSLKTRITGTDLMQEICTNNLFNEQKIFLLGAKQGIAELAAKKLKEINPELKIVGTYYGNPFDLNNVKLINQSNATILFVAYGAPKQEIWLQQNLHQLKTIKIAIGVGGAFDFLSGKVKRAPNFMQKIGLEWLYRLIKEPKRIKRIWNATIKFPYLIIKKRLTETTTN